MLFTELLEKVNTLSDLDRRGWALRGVEDPESVMDHSFKVAFLALLLGDELGEVDKGRLLSLALVHDIGEAEAGDITPLDGIPEEEKMRMERAAFEDMFASGHPNVMALWDELEEGKTQEAQMVKQIDKLDMAFMALQYENQGHDPRALDEFWEDAKRKVKHPVLKKILEEMEGVRGRGI